MYVSNAIVTDAPNSHMRTPECHNTEWSGLTRLRPLFTKMPLRRHHTSSQSASDTLAPPASTCSDF